MHSTLRLALFCTIFLSSCSPVWTGLPTVVDEKLERYVSEIGMQIVAVSEHRDRWSQYDFRLTDFARRDVLGLSTGKQRIFISYELSRLAYRDTSYRWLLRHTLAHEIAHDVLGGDPATEESSGQHGLANRITGQDLGLPSRIKFLPYGRTAELAADRLAMAYWRRLGWHCGHWVRLFKDFIDQGYHGDVDHPTKERLDQAVEICSEQSTVALPRTDLAPPY